MKGRGYKEGVWDDYEGSKGSNLSDIIFIDIIHSLSYFQS